ncbi:hypothetical protein [Rubellimicrobium arenae]|uniref:hypothetical protein n=1 Tax=Rubellimicrobium arenae TaxID=2817372 RepID=UPI001B3035B1|nr:hypothetical protein [Rubellimicrobium arenae]
MVTHTLTTEDLARMIRAGFRAGMPYGADNPFDKSDNLFAEHFPGLEVATDGNRQAHIAALTRIAAIGREVAHG